MAKPMVGQLDGCKREKAWPDLPQTELEVKSGYVSELGTVYTGESLFEANPSTLDLRLRLRALIMPKHALAWLLWFRFPF